MIRLGILGSTRGTNLQALINAIEKKTLDASIEMVISNKESAYILNRAKTQGLSARYIPVNGLTREQYDAELSAALKASQVDLVVLIGYMRLLSADFVKTWQHRVINVHPSLLPAFAGKMDLDVHQAVLDAGHQQTGCSIHYVTEEVDAGPLLVQKTCPVLAGDTAETLKQRVQALEGEALIEAIKVIIKQK